MFVAVAFPAPSEDKRFMGVPIKRVIEIGDPIFDKVAESIEKKDVEDFNELFEKRIKDLIEGLTAKEAFVAGIIFNDIIIAMADEEYTASMMNATIEKIRMHLEKLKRDGEIIVAEEDDGTEIL